MLGRDFEDEVWSRFVVELVIWPNRLLWKDELNPRVCCAFGNVSIYKADFFLYDHSLPSMQAVLFCWELQLMHVTLWPSPTKQHWERSTKAHGLELGQLPWQDTLLVRPTKKSNQVNTDDFISVTQQSQLLRSFDMACCIFSAHWWRFCGRSSREAAWIHKTLSPLQAKFVQ